MILGLADSGFLVTRFDPIALPVESELAVGNIRPRRPAGG